MFCFHPYLNFCKRLYYLCRLSSAGLVYAHFGMEVLTEILSKQSISVNSNSLSNIYKHVYEGFVEELDAIDNGIPMYAEGKPAYKISTHLSARIHRLNPEWNSVPSKPIDELFYDAMEMVGKEFTEAVISVRYIDNNI